MEKVEQRPAAAEPAAPQPRHKYRSQQKSRRHAENPPRRSGQESGKGFDERNRDSADRGQHCCSEDQAAQVRAAAEGGRIGLDSKFFAEPGRQLLRPAVRADAAAVEIPPFPDGEQYGNQKDE